MTLKVIHLLLLMCSVSCVRSFASAKDSLDWKELSRERYTLYYTSTDQNIIKEIDNDLQSGIKHILGYFHHSFLNKFDVYIFPTGFNWINSGKKIGVIQVFNHNAG